MTADKLPVPLCAFFMFAGELYFEEHNTSKLPFLNFIMNDVDVSYYNFFKQLPVFQGVHVDREVFE